MPFDPSHLLLIDFGDYEKVLLSGVNIERLLDTWPKEGAFSVFDKARCLASGGVYDQGNVGICWSLMSEEIRRHPAFLLRTLLRGVNAALANGLNHAVLAIPEDYPGADRWARALGFEFNCVRPSDGLDPRPHLEYVKWPQAQS